MQQSHKSKVARIPFLRGVVVLWDALGLGMRALTISANVQTEEDQKLEGPALYLTLGISLLLGIALFFLLPAALGQLAERFLGVNSWWGNLAEGILRLMLLIGYIWAVGRIPDIRRVFAYHGAEHKTINAYEARAPLTPASVARFTTAHTRCGTSFLLTVMIISIIVLAPFHFDNIFLRLLSRVILIPVVAGIDYEFMRFTAGHVDNRLVDRTQGPVRPYDEGV